MELVEEHRRDDGGGDNNIAEIANSKSIPTFKSVIDGSESDDR